MSYEQVIIDLINRPEVDDVILLHTKGDVTLTDGRIMLPVIIYFNPVESEGGTLGISVEDGIGVKDVVKA